MATRFPSFPPCCQVMLTQLEHENRTGVRNCVKGHSVSIEYAQMIEAKKAAEAAQAANAPKPA